MSGQDAGDAVFAASQEPASPEHLNLIAAAVHEAESLENQITAAEQYVTDLNAQLAKQLTEVIPDLFNQAQTQEWVGQDGTKVTVRDSVSGSLPKEDEEKRAAAIRWIEAMGGASIISADVNLSFDRAHLDRAREAMKLFEGRDDVAVQLKEDVHHMTLKAWARERLKKGMEVDGETLGLWIGKKAEIKRPKPGAS